MGIASAQRRDIVVYVLCGCAVFTDDVALRQPIAMTDAKAQWPMTLLPVPIVMRCDRIHPDHARKFIGARA